ncbi:MAG TPA: hypothetical protein VMG31_10740 [Verrucomicrobiae bacterium]|nr:hypothetical protein [Verrucomicrobiae bacterium]
MKSVKYFASFAIVALVLSVSAVAAKDTNSGSFTLDRAAEIGSIQLAPGHYKVEWSGPASNVKIDVLRHGKTIATAEGQLKDLSHRSPYDAVTLKTLANQTKAVDEIQFSNRTQALKLAD